MIADIKKDIIARLEDRRNGRSIRYDTPVCIILYLCIVILYLLLFPYDTLVLGIHILP